MFISMNKSLPIMFIITGTLITISSSSWFMAWVGLEVNLMAFIPLIVSNNKLSNESTLKYFFIQATGSIIIFMSIIIMGQTNMSNSMDLQNIIKHSLVPLALMLKLGAAPFHFWFPSLMEGMNWMASSFLLTWQKIAPLFLMTSYYTFKPLLYMTIIMSAIIGSMGGLNQMFLRKLMAYSSINHLSWMILASSLSFNIVTLYFFIYSTITIIILLLLSYNNSIHINQLLHNSYSLSTLTVILFMNFLSLGGLPPFLGFFPKWIVLTTTIMNSMFLLSLVLVMCSILTLYFYLRVSFNLLMITPKLIWFNKYPPYMSYNLMLTGLVPIIAFAPMIMI
uniref:NADH-ubiquinone oxidoreductase chain 2 n=1 Tax=Prionopetalum kraepelini TaxID=2931675 RepID=A0A8T9JBW0_9MYRI|nr:NADH dehydrogenase subunit 2 [Prionopetalum kraepelini]UOF70465.1 NADH dehydrogenase subunit 2 [Prionopetalum kraepelini]